MLRSGDKLVAHLRKYNMRLRVHRKVYLDPRDPGRQNTYSNASPCTSTPSIRDAESRGLIECVSRGLYQQGGGVPWGGLLWWEYEEVYRVREDSDGNT